MIDDQDVRDVLTKCSAYDPSHFPRESRVIFDAWREHFAMFPLLTRDDVLGAVTTYYLTPERKVPQPADISRIARNAWRERWDQGDEDLRKRHEALCDSKAAPDDTPSIEAGAEPNSDPAVVAARRQAIAGFAAGKFAVPADANRASP